MGVSKASLVPSLSREWNSGVCLTEFLNSGMNMERLTHRVYMKDNFPHPTATSDLPWHLTIMPLLSFNTYQLDFINYFDPVGPGIPETRHGFLILTNGLAVALYSLIYPLKLIDAGAISDLHSH